MSDVSVGISLGAAAVLSCYLVCLCASWQSWHELEFANPKDKVELSERVLCCLRLAAVYQPAASLKGIIPGGLAARPRFRPNPAQLLPAFRAFQTHCSDHQLLPTTLRDHNQAEAVSKSEVSPYEIKVLHTFESLCQQALLKLVLDQGRPAHSHAHQGSGPAHPALPLLG